MTANKAKLNYHPELIKATRTRQDTTTHVAKYHVTAVVVQYSEHFPRENCDIFSSSAGRKSDTFFPQAKKKTRCEVKKKIDIIP